MLSSEKMLVFLERLIKLFLFILTPVLLALSVSLNASLTDSFHEGEYLGNLTAVQQYYLDGKFPVLVHGAMDFIPAAIARTLSDERSAIVGTRLVNVLIVAVAWILFIEVARRLLGRSSRVLLLIFIFSFLWIAASSGTNPVALQQAFVGVRDVFLMSSILFAVMGIGAEKSNMKMLLLSLAGGGLRSRSIGATTVV